MKLNELAVGKSAAILRVGGKGALRQHFLDMGMIPGAEVTVIKLAPMGDPMELQIHGYELTLRLAEAEQIEIKPIQKIKNRYKDTERIKASEHPGLGEDGKYHSKAEENPLPDGTKLTYALVGNQNCGKTKIQNEAPKKNPKQKSETNKALQRTKKAPRPTSRGAFFIDILHCFPVSVAGRQECGD